MLEFIKILILMPQNNNGLIKISEPITEKDFLGILNLVEENLYKNNLKISRLKSLSFGELLIAKDGEKIIGMVETRRPGRVFVELEDKYFSLDKMKIPKNQIGFIPLIAVSPDYQKKGVGKKLLMTALQVQKQWHAVCVGAHIWQNSPGGGSQKLFTKIGFTPLKLHEKPWKEYSEKVGPEGYWCVVCGNPCHCDYLEMMKYL